MNNIMKLADAAIDCARLAGVTEAKEDFGVYTESDSRFFVSMHQSISKHRAALEATVTAFEKDAKRTLHLLKQALSVIDGSYSEDYDEAFEGAVSDALRKEITDMETK